MLRLALLAGLIGILAGCSNKPPKAVVELAIVPGADVICRANFKAMSQAAVNATFLELINKQKTAHPVAGTVERLLKSMELKENDVLAALLSLDLDTISQQDLKKSMPEYELANMAFALQVAKPVAFERFKAELSAEAAQWPGIVVGATNIAGKSALVLQPFAPELPPVYCAISADGFVLYSTLNSTSMEALFKRERKSAIEQVSPDLAILAGDSGNAQLQAAVVLPEPARAALREAFEKPKALGEIGILMAMGLLQPLKALVSFSMDFAFGQVLKMNLGLEFDDETSAQQAHSLFQGVLLPMLQGALGARHDDEAHVLDKLLTCANKGRSVTVTFTLNEQDLLLCLGKKPAQTGTGPTAP